MEIFLIILVIIVLLANVLLLMFFLNKRKGGQDDATTAAASAAANAANADALGLKLILEQVNELARTVDTKISGLNQSMSDNIHRQFSESKKIISDVTDKLGKLDETNRQ